MNPILLKVIEALVGMLAAFLIEAIRKLSSRDVANRLATIAITHVKILMSSGMGNEERRKAAFEGIKKDCATLGIDAKDWLINLAIEVAVGKVKADAPPE